MLPGSGPAPRLYDTATGELVLAAAGPVATLYACGITPYDATHIGHAATYTAWDLLVRAWLDARYTVIYVQNVTDVDDPLLERADRDGEDWRELARRETQRYRGDMEALRVLPPAHLIGAVEALPVIERFSARMADRGALYDVDEDVYFARSADRGSARCPGRARPPATTWPRWPSSPPSAAATRAARARKTRWTAWSGGPNGPASRPGTRGSAAAGPAGTSSAPRSPPSTWAPSSTSRRAVLTWCSRTTR